MNELPIGSLCLHKDFWNRHVANISSTANTHQRAGREWDPVATYTKMGWSITLPGKEINTTNIFFTQKSSEDYEEFGKLNVLGLADPPTGAQAVVYESSWNSCKKATRDGTRHDSREKGNHSPLETNKEGSRRRVANLCSETGKVK